MLSATACVAGKMWPVVGEEGGFQARVKEGPLRPGVDGTYVIMVCLVGDSVPGLRL